MTNGFFRCAYCGNSYDIEWTQVLDVRGRRFCKRTHYVLWVVESGDEEDRKNLFSPEKKKTALPPFTTGQTD